MAGGLKSLQYVWLGGNVGAAGVAPPVGGYTSFTGFWMGHVGSLSLLEVGGRVLAGDGRVGRVSAGTGVTGRRLEGDNKTGRVV